MNNKIILAKKEKEALFKFNLNLQRTFDFEDTG